MLSKQNFLPFTTFLILNVFHQKNGEKKIFFYVSLHDVLGGLNANDVDVIKFPSSKEFSQREDWNII